MSGADGAERSPARGAYGLLLGHAVLVQFISYGMRAALSYELLALGKDGVWLGYAATAFALPPLLLALPAGRLVTRFGERLSLVIGALFFLAGVAVTFGASSAQALVVSSALLGCGVLFSVVSEQSWVMRTAPTSKLDFSFGMYTLATSSGQMVGPLVLLLPGFGPDGPLPAPNMLAVSLVCVAMSLALLLISCGVPSSGARDAADAKSGGGVLALLKQRGVPSALIASSVVLTSLDIVIVYLPLLAEEQGVSPAWVSVILVVRGASTMVSRLTLSLVTARFGRRGVLVAGGAVAGCATLALALVPAPAFWVVAVALYGLAAGTVQPLTMSWMTLITPMPMRSMAASLRLVGNRVGQTSIPMLAAALSSLGGAAAVFVLMAAGLISSAVLSRVAPNNEDAE